MTETRGSDTARSWRVHRGFAFGRAVAHARRDLGLSASELASRTSALGFPITRGTIARIEGNHRDGKVDLTEVVVLAEALEVPPLSLIYDENIPPQYVPGDRGTPNDARQRFIGALGNDYQRGFDAACRSLRQFIDELAITTKRKDT